MPNVDVNIKSFFFDLEESSGPLLSAYGADNLKIFKLLLENKQIDVNATYYLKIIYENEEIIEERISKTASLLLFAIASIKG